MMLLHPVDTIHIRLMIDITIGDIIIDMIRMIFDLLGFRRVERCGMGKASLVSVSW